MESRLHNRSSINWLCYRSHDRSACLSIIQHPKSLYRSSPHGKENATPFVKIDGRKVPSASRYMNKPIMIHDDKDLRIAYLKVLQRAWSSSWRNKTAELSQRTPRDAPNIWVPWKVLRVLTTHPATFPEISNGLLFRSILRMCDCAYKSWSL